MEKIFQDATLVRFTSIWRPSQRLYQILNLQSDAPPLLPGENSGVLTIANGEQQEKKSSLFSFLRVVMNRIHCEEKEKSHSEACVNSKWAHKSSLGFSTSHGTFLLRLDIGKSWTGALYPAQIDFCRNVIEARTQTPMWEWRGLELQIKKKKIEKEITDEENRVLWDAGITRMH